MLSTQDQATRREPISPRCAPTLPGSPGVAGAIADRLDIAGRPGAAADEFSRRFRIDGVIAAGGMGVVVTAQHLALDKRVAIKLMRPELRVRRDLVRRFVREARAAARLRSPNITQVFDVGTLDDGAPYIVMEYLDGMDLAAWARQRGPAPVPLAAAMLTQVIHAIAEAHAVGIVHRDLKPSNLFVTRDSAGELLVKVLDLGICKLAERSVNLPDTRSIATSLGTPAYMAPEQFATSRRVDARADIWSLGVILYELVTGRAPFQGSSPDDLRARVTCDPHPPMELAGVASDLEPIVARCLAKDPAARFQAVTELEVALAPFIQGARQAVGASSPLIARTRRRSRQWVWAAAGVAALAIAGMSGLRSSLRADSMAAGTHVEIPRPQGSLRQPARAPQPAAPAPVAPRPMSRQPGPVLQSPALVRSRPEPASAAPVPPQPTRTASGARAATALRSPFPAPVGDGAASETTPPRTPVDPLDTPY